MNWKVVSEKAPEEHDFTSRGGCARAYKRCCCSAIEFTMSSMWRLRPSSISLPLGIIFTDFYM